MMHEHSTENIWAESARRMIQEVGFAEARRLCIEHRNLNAPGTVSFDWHNAVLQYLTKGE